MLFNSIIRCDRISIGGAATKSTVHRKMRRRRCITIAKKLTHRVSLFLLFLTFVLQLLSIHALPKDTNRNDNNKDSSIISPYTASVIKKQTAQTKKIEHDFKIQTEKLENDIKENQLKMEHDIKENQLKIRKYWKQTFKEIKASNPVVFGEEDEEYKRLMLDRWKLFSDSGSRRVNIIDDSSSELVDTEFKQAILVDNSADVDDDDETTYKKKILLSKAKRIPAPLRFDGFKTWEKQLQEWKDDVSMYIEKLDIEFDQAESRPSWFRALLQPKERSRYDMSTYTVSSDRLQSLTATTTSQTTPKLDLESLAQRAAMKVKERLEAVGEEETIQIGTDGSASSSNQQQLQSSSQPTATLYPKSNTISPPITLTNLDPNLPSIPKPRPVTSTDAIVPHTDIADKSKNIWIVTTGALPWMTGTAVNPLLRAAYLSSGRKEEGGSVTLMLPWVEREDDQERVYGRKDRFTSPADQEEYIRTWLKDTANMPKASKELNIKWYTAWQEVLENSLYSMGDITALIPQEECDIVVLEEPEHLNWYRAPGENWISKYKHVVGIVHTNYFVYATEQPAAFIRAPGMRLLSSWMCRVHCHRIIKLSGTLQAFAPEKELIENVHGVRRSFLDIGEELRTKLASPSIDSDPIFSSNATPTVYFIGKMLWSKGLESLMDLIKYAEDSAGLKVKVDMYGGGPNKDEASEKATTMGLDMTYHGPIDHAELGSTHKVFINPSTSEVLCTTVAEALAMGKFVVLPSHPSNDFFAQFPNCLPYTNKEEFVGNLYYALTHSPEPLTEEYSYALSWEAATERFAAAGSISAAEAEATAEALSSTEAGIDVSFFYMILGIQYSCLCL